MPENGPQRGHAAHVGEQAEHRVDGGVDVTGHGGAGGTGAGGRAVVGIGDRPEAGGGGSAGAGDAGARGADGAQPAVGDLMPGSAEGRRRGRRDGAGPQGPERLARRSRVDAATVVTCSTRCRTRGAGAGRAGRRGSRAAGVGCSGCGGQALSVARSRTVAPAATRGSRAGESIGPVVRPAQPPPSRRRSRRRRLASTSRVEEPGGGAVIVDADGDEQASTRRGPPRPQARHVMEATRRRSWRGPSAGHHSRPRPVPGPAGCRSRGPGCWRMVPTSCVARHLEVVNSAVADDRANNRAAAVSGTLCRRWLPPSGASRTAGPGPTPTAGPVTLG